MKAILTAAALAVLPMAASSAETVFIGNVFIDFVSGGTTCTQDFAVGDFARAIFRPKGSGNGANSALAYVTTRSSFVMLVQNNQFQSGLNYAGSGVSSTNGLISNAGGITVWSQASNATGLAIKGRFANFFGITGCIVEFNGNMVQR